MKFTKKPNFYNRNNNSKFNTLQNLQNSSLQFNPMSFNSKPVVSKPVVSKPVVYKPVVSKPVVFKSVVSKPVVSKPVVFKSVNTNKNNLNIFKKENKTISLENFISNNKITHVRISDSLKHFEKRFIEKYKLNLYDHTKDSNSNTIFFGFYDNRDLINIKTHKGKAFLMFGGTDLSEHFNLIPIYQRNLQFICISNDIQKRLVDALQLKTRSANLNSLIRKIWNVEMNMVDKKIFKPVDKISTKIYVYDGYIDKPQNRKIYNTDIVEQVKNQFPQIEFIHSSKIQANYEDMPSIYADCFIGLRLTNNDGNANTVQELEAMNIPVVHNHSHYGLKWKTVADIVNHINLFNSNYHNNRVAWGLDTSYAGYPFISKYLDCRLIVYNYRLSYWDNKCPNLYSYINNKKFVLNELYHAEHLYIFGAMSLRYLINILSSINKKLSNYKVTFFITDWWYIKDKKLNNDTIYKTLLTVEELEILVMPDLVPYVKKDGLSFRPYYQHIPIEMKDNISKYDDFTVVHSPGLKRSSDHKGTSIIEAVCKDLNVKLIVIENCTWEKCIEIKKKGHIFIDQIITDKVRKEIDYNDYYGGVGKSGLEAMKCGILTIVSGYQGTLLGTPNHPPPPVCLVKNKEELKNMISFYINNLDTLKVNAAKQKEYADKYTSFDFVLNNVSKNIKKIKQIRVSKNIAFFSDKMKNKYGFKDYNDINEPVLFFGLYNQDDYNEVKKHRGPIVFLWAGTDARYVNQYQYLRKEAQNISRRGRHIAISSCVQKRLKKVNISSEFIPICPTIIKKNVQPKGDCVYFYGKGKNYGEELVPKIQKRIPYKIIKTLPNSFSSKELQEVYKKCFIGLRLTPVDGLSNTVVELGLMGRKVIYNCNPLPNAIKYSDIDSIVEIINEEYKNKKNNSESIAEEMVNYFDKYHDYWLYVST